MWDDFVGTASKAVCMIYNIFVGVDLRVNPKTYFHKPGLNTDSCK